MLIKFAEGFFKGELSRRYHFQGPCTTTVTEALAP